MVVLTEISEEPPSSSSSLTTYNYDVFLSFRGEDTRNNFTDHLLNALQEATINTFFDDTVIQIGDYLKPELEYAIKSSRASIIVLSENYASSTWCLDELALIMEQNRSCKHIVFPIFYHVKPSDVRKQRKSFGDAMADHKQRLKEETNEAKRSRLAKKIEKWKKALTEVADMKGEEATGRKETILIKAIVKEMKSRLELHKRSAIPIPIGMESSVRTITSFLNNASSDTTEFLTIWGMAGIGKTYLAEYIFKSHYHEFERSCFLEDIERQCTQSNGLLELQKQLLIDVGAGSTCVGMNNVSVATFTIEKALTKKRTFLVLDGINNFEQIDVLIGTKGLHAESKIIITSKNGSLTEKCKLFETQVPPKHTKLLLQGLAAEDSLQLLSSHAFGQNRPNEGDINNKLIKLAQYCDGHPLALKVLGSSIRSDDATLEDILESLGKEINPRIMEVLKVSFDALPSEKDKQLFKHIACLLVGADRKFSEDLLKACGIYKSYGFKILIDRSLLTIGSSDKLMMHQLLQDMGRYIVRQESPNKPWKRSILWHHEECLDVLENKKGTKTIQGFVLDMRKFENGTSKESSSPNKQKFGVRSWRLFKWVLILLSAILWLIGWVWELRSSSHTTKGDFKTLAFSGMCNLKILQLNYVRLSGSYKNFPQGLRWLCMHGFSLSYIPSDLQLEYVVALDMPNSKLRGLWKKPKMLRSLKFLNLSSCQELVSVGHFSRFPLLERLTLARCTSLVEVCESIGNYCPNLEVLDLSECHKLKKLPKSIGKLKNLTQLLLNNCSNLAEVHVEMKDMESLKVLSVDLDVPSSSDIVKAIPRSFRTSSLPRSLVELSLINNNLSNESFPEDFGSLTMLKVLYLDKNPIYAMPDGVRSLSRLERLSFSECRKLKMIFCVPNKLKYLSIYKCYSLNKLVFHPEESSPPEVYDVGVSYFLSKEVLGTYVFSPGTMNLDLVRKLYS